MRIDTTYNRIARKFLQPGAVLGRNDSPDTSARLLMPTESIDKQPAQKLSTTGGSPIYLVNLDRSADRLAEFQRRNAHLSNVVRFAAVDGKALDRKELIGAGVIAPDCGYTVGALGNAMSHITLWKRAVAQQITMSISEDDAVFSHIFEEQANRAMAMLPSDWDIIFWGWNFDAPLRVAVLPGVSEANLQCDQEHLRQNLSQFQRLKVSPILVRMLHAWGTMCYTVSPKGAQALLSMCLPLRPTLIDIAVIDRRIEAKTLDATLNTAHPLLKSFVCIPPLVVSENRHDTSTVVGKLQ